MGFVLVPVPAEHVLDVMRWVLFRADAVVGDEPGRDATSVSALVASAGPEIRTLLGLVADATIRGEPPRLRDLADDLGQDAADLNDAIDELNLHALKDQRPLLEIRTETAVGATGVPGRIAYVSMREELARVARASLRREALR